MSATEPLRVSALRAAVADPGSAGEMWAAPTLIHFHRCHLTTATEPVPGDAKPEVPVEAHDHQHRKADPRLAHKVVHGTDVVSTRVGAEAGMRVPLAEVVVPAEVLPRFCEELLQLLLML